VLDLLAPQVGLEPTTLRLTAECSPSFYRRAFEELKSSSLSTQSSCGKSVRDMAGYQVGVPNKYAVAKIIHLR
jgi:hypothetical protein